VSTVDAQTCAADRGCYIAGTQKAAEITQADAFLANVVRVQRHVRLRAALAPPSAPFDVEACLPESCAALRATLKHCGGGRILLRTKTVGRAVSTVGAVHRRYVDFVVLRNELLEHFRAVDRRAFRSCSKLRFPSFRQALADSTRHGLMSWIPRLQCPDRSGPPERVFAAEQTRLLSDLSIWLNGVLDMLEQTESQPQARSKPRRPRQLREFLGLPIAESSLDYPFPSNQLDKFKATYQVRTVPSQPYNLSDAACGEPAGAGGGGGVLGAFKRFM